MSAARLIVGDALEAMRSLPDSSVDAVITDPPYCSGGISKAGRKAATKQGVRPETVGRFGWFESDNMGTAGLVWLLRSVALESTRFLTPGGWLLVFCDWRMLSSLQPAIESASLSYRSLVVWDKGAMGMGHGFRAQHELILAFSHGAPAVHDRSISNVLTVKRHDRNDREHPTQKPVELMARLVRATTPAGGVVLDPFMGSGTTGVAAVGLGRRFIGIEREQRFADVASRRIAEAEAPSLLAMGAK
jgi:DNA modification methylase